MFDPAILAGYAVTVLIVELTPGPNMAWLALLSATEGRRAGFAATAGIAAGLLTIAMVSALGLATLISQNAMVYEGLRWAGVIFLLYLAWEGWESGDKPSAPSMTPGRNGQHALRGLVINILNPKAALFYITIMPEFIVPTGSVHLQTVTLALISVLIATGVHLSLVVLAGSVQGVLADSKRKRLIHRALSLLLVGVAVWLFLSTAR